MPELRKLAMQRTVFTCFALALLLAGPGLARGQVTLYQQSPDRNFGQASDTLFRLDGGQVTASQVADDFALPSGGSVCAVAWWGFYGGSFVQFDPPPPVSETMRVRFYANAAGLPGAVLAEHTLVNPSRQWTGQMLMFDSPFRREYLYESALPGCFAAAPGVTYWFEVVQVGDVNSVFRWETAPPGNNRFAILFPPGTPWRISGQPDDFAFVLRTPEPASFVFVVCAFVGAMRRKKQ